MCRTEQVAELTGARLAPLRPVFLGDDLFACPGADFSSNGPIACRAITAGSKLRRLPSFPMSEGCDTTGPGLRSIVVVKNTRAVAGKTDREMRLYITSLVLLANQIGPMIRGHWMIENGMHWMLDMIFRDDESRVRTDNSSANLAIINMAYNVMRMAQTRDSMRRRRKVATWV